mgnify:FL=1
MTAVMLAVAVMCGILMGSYQEAQASGIVAGGAIVGTLEEILLSFGIFLLPSSMANSAQNSDWWYSEDGNAALKPYYDDLASEYEKERFKVINGGGGDPQPSPTPVPEQKPEIQPTPIPQVKPGEIPTFDELVAPALAGGAISWASGAWDTMAKAVGNLWDKIFGTVSNAPEGLSEDEVNVIVNSGCCYYYTYEATSSYYGSDYKRVYHLGGIGSYLQGSTISSASCGVRSPYKLIYPSHTQEGNTGGLFGGKYGYNQRNFFTNMPLFSSSAEVDQWRDQQLANADKYTKENIWVHPDLQETYQNNGKLEYPQEAPQPLQYPSAENLADLAKKLNPEINPDYSPEIAPNYVQELIQKLQQDPSVNPDPNPNPNPDPGTNPQPTLKPNPTGTPEDPTPEQEASPYKADLREVFPFCIPFDLIHLLKVFEADAEAPVFEFPLDIELDNPWTGEKVVDYHHTFKLDMSDYEPVVKILRIFQVVFFIIALMLITRQQMIKG